jgi:hypothetical protein
VEDKPFIPAETRPRIVESLLAALPVSHPVAAAQALLEPLSLLNRQAVRPDVRLKLLEIYRPVVLEVTQSLAAQCSGHALPLPENAVAAAATARVLLTEFAYGYKLAILDHISRVFAIGGNKTLSILTQRAIHTLDQLLQVSYYTYTSAPEGIWSEIHRLYLHGAQHGTHDAEVMDLGVKSSINLTYTNALLLALSSPQRLVSADVESVRDYLARFGHLAQLQPLGKPENPSGIFLVQLKSDQPAIPLAKHKGTADMRTDILLITVELARQISNHLTGLQENEAPGKLGLPETARQQRYQDLLAHLLKHWALAPKRISTRLSKNESINLCAGLEPAHYFFNGETPFAKIDEENNESEISLNFTNSPDNTDNSRRYDTSRWLVVNESAGGMAISKFPGVSLTLRVGELLGLRRDRDSQLSLGVVRRATSGDSGDLEIGAQMLAPCAKAVAVRPENGGDFTRALLLPALLPLKQPATLITGCGIYQPARVLEVTIDADAAPVRVLATKLIERTNSFERFQFSPL